MGLIPMMLPNYQRTSDESALQDFERLWNHPLPTTPGLTVVEIMQAIYKETIEGLYIMGENPAMSDPNLNHTRAALAKLKHLVVQDIFFTETASYADVILPASAFAEKTGTFTNTDRRVQMARQAIDLPGAARQDLWIIQKMAERLGLNWFYPDVQSVFEEIRQAVSSIAGMTWQRLENEHSLTYPLTSEDDSGTAVLFTNGFPTKSGRARFVPALYSEADELPDETYPMVFTTGRQLEHWHTGSMTRRSSVLNTLQPEPVINIHPQDMNRHGLEQGQSVIVQSRRGEIQARCHGDSGLHQGSVFMAFCYYEAAANLLTNEALDPVAKIPEFKYCAVRLVTDSMTQI